MLPMLHSALVAAISFSTPNLAGPSTIRYIAAVALATLSEVQAIIPAEAGVKASTENMAAVSKILFIVISHGNETGLLPAFGIDILSQQCFREKSFLFCCSAANEGAPATPAQRFGRSPTLPVAISGSHAALPRSGASHL